MLIWKSINSIQELGSCIDGSKKKPALIFKHRTISPESHQTKEVLEKEWDISSDQMDCYIIDVMQYDVAAEVSEIASVANEFPQVLLFLDGVIMYDESHEMISLKKIKLALKIIERTFKWVESRE